MRSPARFITRSSSLICTLACGLSFLVISAAAPARADDDVDTAEPDRLAEIYRKVALPPFIERRVQAILQDEWQKAQENAQKVGLRRMSRRHFRRALIALDRSTDTRIRALIGAKKFGAWKRARASYTLTPGEHRQSPVDAGARWLPDRCAGLGRTLRGSDLADATAEEAYVWIHTHARHC